MLHVYAMPAHYHCRFHIVFIYLFTYLLFHWHRHKARESKTYKTTRKIEEKCTTNFETECRTIASKAVIVQSSTDDGVSISL